MENNSESFNHNSINIIDSIDEICDRLDLYIKSIRDEEIKVEGDLLNRSYAQVLRSILDERIIKIKQYIENNLDFFKNEELAEILISDLYSFLGSLTGRGNRTEEEQQNYVLERTKRFIEKFGNLKLSIISLQNANQLINNQLQPAIDEVKEKVKDFESLQLALEHRETNKIYLDLHDKYKKEFVKNNNYFFYTLVAAVVITLFTSIKINSLNLFFTTELNYWVMFITVKLLILTITITLCTLFLRRASHAKKLYEQAYQTHVEINAFPIHVRSLKDEDKHELIKELALKYFGKELDQTQNDKIGDLMQDQITSGTELIRASAEMLKAKNGAKDE